MWHKHKPTSMQQTWVHEVWKKALYFVFFLRLFDWKNDKLKATSQCCVGERRKVKGLLLESILKWRRPWRPHKQLVQVYPAKSKFHWSLKRKVITSFSGSHLGESYRVAVALSSCVEVDSLPNFLLKEKSQILFKKQFFRYSSGNTPNGWFYFESSGIQSSY